MESFGLPQRVLFALLPLTLLACSPDDGGEEPTACPASSVCAASSTNTLAVGERQGDALVAFSSGQKLEIIHGPQGGQHVLADAALSTDEPGNWTVVFQLVDPNDGMMFGSSTRRLRVCSCPSFLQNVAVILNSDADHAGTLKVSAESPSGKQVAAPDVDIEAVQSL